MSKLYGYLIAAGSLLIAFFAAMKVGKYKQKANQAEADVVAKDKAIKEDQEGQRIYNEGIEKDAADIRDDTYFK